MIIQNKTKKEKEEKKGGGEREIGRAGTKSNPG